MSAPAAPGDPPPDVDYLIVLAQQLFALKAPAADLAGVPTGIDRPALKAVVLAGLVAGDKARAE